MEEEINDELTDEQKRDARNMKHKLRHLEMI